MNEAIQYTQNLLFTMGDSILEICYLVASILFIFGLKKLSHAESARKGNFLAAIGMGLAILATLLFHRMDGEPIRNIPLIFVAIGIGTIPGWHIDLCGFHIVSGTRQPEGNQLDGLCIIRIIISIWNNLRHPDWWCRYAGSYLLAELFYRCGSSNGRLPV